MNGFCGHLMMSDKSDLRRSIQSFSPSDEQEKRDKGLMLLYLEQFPDILLRQNTLAHFTASSWIVNPEKTKVLLIYHNTYDSWAWTGGHADGEADLLRVAVKEAREETGVELVQVLKDEPFSLEIICANGHYKRGEYVSSHLHLNLTYLLEADENSALRIKEDENSGVRWAGLDEVFRLSSEPWMKKIYTKLNSKLLQK